MEIERKNRWTNDLDWRTADEIDIEKEICLCYVRIWLNKMKDEGEKVNKNMSKGIS